MVAPNEKRHSTWGAAPVAVAATGGGNMSAPKRREGMKEERAKAAEWGQSMPVAGPVFC